MESELSKCAKLPANIILELEGKKRSKTYFNVLKRQCENQTLSELYTDNKKTKYSSNPSDILKSAKNFHEKLYTKRKPPKPPLLNS